MGKKRDVCGRFGGKLWSTGKGGRPLGCNYPYECSDGERTGPVWGSDSDQGDDCVRGVETDTQTDGRRLAEEEDGTPPSLPGPPKKKTKKNGQPGATRPRSEAVS